MNGYTYGDDIPITKTDPDGKWVWLVINAGFAIYDGYKAYKAGKNKKQIAWAVASNFLPMGKVKRVFRAVKFAKKASCNCFVAGTKVLTDEGEKNIEDIEVGDMVLAKDENNPEGELAYKKVTNLYRNQRDDIIKLYVEEQIIETTDNHPFWVEGKGWVYADELQIGDKLQKADGSNLTIDKVEFVKLDEPVTVYNFTVEDYHTYYVTDIGVWVHNTSCASVRRTKHILYGDKSGGGHLWPGNGGGKTLFPKSWNGQMIMRNVSDIATDPKLKWKKGNVVKGKQRWVVIGIRNGLKIKVVTDGRDIITAFPIK
ncbi:polymorphic toxin-type HINT domain-containing protein [Lysinibacillus sp. NPDC092081]|uniref:polymorphic toxin-type HINT domain-containing protein n=1 Tax=Lysinibacillus sp. NPDC092081 TaxID=3364131 RepID=UPI0037F3F0EA